MMRKKVRIVFELEKNQAGKTQRRHLKTQVNITSSTKICN
jgi:hypothetical protein